jgi:hypothetical protein
LLETQFKGLQMFKPDTTPLAAVDPENGVKLVIGASSDLDTLRVAALFSDGRKFVFDLILRLILHQTIASFASHFPR